MTNASIDMYRIADGLPSLSDITVFVMLFIILLLLFFPYCCFPARSIITISRLSLSSVHPGVTTCRIGIRCLHCAMHVFDGFLISRRTWPTESNVRDNGSAHSVQVPHQTRDRLPFEPVRPGRQEKHRFVCSPVDTRSYLQAAVQR